MGEDELSREKAQFRGNSASAKKHLDELFADPGSKKMWAELKKRTEVSFNEAGEPVFSEKFLENEKFADLRKSVGEDEWIALVHQLNGMRRNLDEEGWDIDGNELEGEEAFLELAADLKDFDPQRFEQNFGLSGSLLIELKQSVLAIDDPQFFFEKAEELKILYPDEFKHGRFSIPGRMWDGVIKRLKSLTRDWDVFLDLYATCVFLDEEEITRRLPITPRTWRKILQYVEGLGDKGHVFGRMTAKAQICRPAGERMKSPTVSPADWEWFVKELQLDFNKSKNTRHFIRDARGLKYLKVEPEKSDAV